MAGEYRVVRAEDVTDQSANMGFDPDLFEIRFLRSDLGCEHCGVSYMRLSPRFRGEYGHRHKRQEEIYMLVSGRAQALVGNNDVIDLEPWTALRVPPETPRALRAVGNEDAIVIAVGAPNTGPGDGLPAPDGFAWPD